MTQSRRALAAERRARVAERQAAASTATDFVEQQRDMWRATGLRKFREPQPTSAIECNKLDAATTRPTVPPVEAQQRSLVNYEDHGNRDARSRYSTSKRTPAIVWTEIIA
jgi:hypothetical protein